MVNGNAVDVSHSIINEAETELLTRVENTFLAHGRLIYFLKNNYKLSLENRLDLTILFLQQSFLVQRSQ